MPNERVLSLPLSSDEIIEILLQRFEKKLRSDCFLHPANTYNGFSYSLELKLKFADMMLGRDTLVWDQYVDAKKEVAEAVQSMIDNAPAGVSFIEADSEASASETFDSGESPNRAREEHGLPMPVETTEGRRKVIRRRQVEG